MSEVNAYPLCWPMGQKRTPHQLREVGTFQGSPGKVQRELLQELDRLVLGQRARTHRLNNVIISTNIPVKLDGFPYANAREPSDPGVAVYFKRKGRDQCFACDRYDRVWKNMRALTKTIEAMRGIERWGSSDALDRAFMGFAALPAPVTERPYWDILGMPESATLEELRTRYHELARRYHPDANGGREDPRMADINLAWSKAREGLK